MRPHENPFRSSKVLALTFRMSEPLPALIGRLRAGRFRGAIVGPVGSGKSTLLREVAEALVLEGLTVRTLRFDDHAALLAAVLDRRIVLCVDGAERIPLPLRIGLVAGARRIVLTAHAAVPGISVLARTETTPALLAELLQDLGVPCPSSDVEALFLRCQGDIRSAFQVLYDEASQDLPGAFRARYRTSV